MSRIPTLEALAETFKGQDVDKVRSPGAVSLSYVGSCRRRAAYRLAGQPWEFGLQESRAAALGTAQHDWLLPRLAHKIATLTGDTPLVEHAVWVAAPWGPMHGRLDLYVSRLLLDLKTVGEHGLSRVLRFGVKAQHVAQVGGYVLGLREQGHDVEAAEVLYLDRANGDAVALPVDPDGAADVAAGWILEVYGYGVNPELAPRDEHGPGLSVVCDGCEFIRACWGPSAVRGKVGGQEVLAADAPAIGAALAAYDGANATIKEATQVKEFARAVLEGAPKGDYPGGFSLSWRGGWAPKPVPDGKAAIERLEELGEPVPTKLDEGRRSSINVRPSRVEPPAIQS